MWLLFCPASSLGTARAGCSQGSRAVQAGPHPPHAFILGDLGQDFFLKNPQSCFSVLMAGLRNSLGAETSHLSWLRSHLDVSRASPQHVEVFGACFSAHLGADHGERKLFKTGARLLVHELNYIAFIFFHLLKMSDWTKGLFSALSAQETPPGLAASCWRTRKTTGTCSLAGKQLQVSKAGGGASPRSRDVLSRLGCRGVGS